MSMRAAVNTRYGGPEVVHVTDVAVPEVGEREISVRVRATTVNRTDVAYRRAYPFVVRVFTGLVRPKRTILGTEFAGEVETVAPGVTRFAVGDLVFGYVEGPFGAHAQHLVVREDAPIEKTPEGIDAPHAAAATEGSHYALASMRAGRVGEGTRVLVYGATGAIGSAAVQLMKAAGATVTAVCGTAHLDLVAALGAERVIDYQTTDIATVEGEFDVVFDAAGKTSYPACRHLLSPTGVFLATDFGPFPTNLGWALITLFSRGHTVKMPPPGDTRAAVARLREELAAGRFLPVIDEHRFTLAQIAEAHRYVDSGQKIGNVVVDVP